MEEVYMEEIPEFKMLNTIYNIEKETAKKQGRLKVFPKFGCGWKPEGSEAQMVNSSMLGGLAKTAVFRSHYTLENKHHSCDNNYISEGHPTKSPSVVYIPSGDDPKALQFGVIKQLFQHSFAQRTFVWASVAVYEKCELDPSSGLWFSPVSSLSDSASLFLITAVSFPLMVAHADNHIWFLDS